MKRFNSSPRRLLTNRSFLLGIAVYAVVAAVTLGYSAGGGYHGASSSVNAAGEENYADAGTSATPFAAEGNAEGAAAGSDAVAGATPLGGEAGAFGEGLIADASTAASPLSGNAGTPGTPGTPGSGAAPDMTTGATPGGGYVEPAPAPGVEPPPDTNTGATPPAPEPAPTPDPVTPPDSETGATPPAPTPTPDPAKPPEDDDEDEDDDDDDEFEKDSLSVIFPASPLAVFGGMLVGLSILEARRRRGREE